MFKTILAAAAIAATLFTGAQAEARTWWVYNSGQDRCQIAPASPDSFIQFSRSSNEFSGPPNVETYRDNGGQVSGVMVTATYTTGNKTTLLFFSNPQYCQTVRQDMHNEGMVTNRSELQ